MAKDKVEIAIVESNKKIMDGYKRLLETENDLTIIAELSNATSFLNHNIKHNPDIIVFDASQAELNGSNVIMQLSSLMPNVKILVTSVHLDSRFVIRMLHAGASGYMLKDRAEEDFISALKTVISNHTFISPGIAGITYEGSEYLKG
ncbi:response regulator transcription factor [Candidatus Latescibacterota bacterium]